GQIKNEIDDVAAVELAGVEGQLGDQVGGTHHGDAVDQHVLPALGEFAVAARFGGEVDHHGTGFHALLHGCGDQHRRPAARHLRGGDDDVGGAHELRERLLLAGDEIVRLRFCVAALVGLRGQTEIDEFTADAADLL